MGWTGYSFKVKIKVNSYGNYVTVGAAKNLSLYIVLSHNLMLKKEYDIVAAHNPLLSVQPFSCIVF